MVMIKSFLSALPIFQSSLLLSPKSISSQISKLLRDFLYNGGKGNQNKMHLVRWDIIKRPISEGGLQIWDPNLAHLEMGDKLIWKLYVDKNHHVSEIFRMKYLKGDSLRSLISFSTLAGTTIWNSCRKGIDKFNQQLYRIPGNGKRILLWEDKISGNTPLSSVTLL